MTSLRNRARSTRVPTLAPALAGLLAPALAGLLAAISAPACGGDDDARGQLVVPYVLGNGRTCDELGVATIEANLDDGFITEEVECGTGEISLRDVPIGAYNVVLFGYDEDNIPVLDSAAGEPVRVEIFTGTTTEVDPEVLLTAAPAQLFVRWGFKFSDCETEGIDRFVVRAWHTDGTQLLSEHTLDCATPGEGVGRYRRVDDGDRTLTGDVFGEVSIQPLDPEGMSVGDAIRFVFDPQGPGYPVRISLTECTSSGCQGTGDLD